MLLPALCVFIQARLLQCNSTSSPFAVHSIKLAFCSVIHQDRLQYPLNISLAFHAPVVVFSILNSASTRIIVIQSAVFAYFVLNLLFPQYLLTTSALLWLPCAIPTVSLPFLFFQVFIMDSTRATSPTPSTSTVFEEVEDSTQITTMHCLTEQWSRLANYRFNPNWSNLPSDLKDIITGLLSWDCCPCGENAIFPPTAPETSDSATTSNFEIRLNRIEAQISTIAASIGNRSTPRTKAVRSKPKKIVLISPEVLDRSRAIELVHLAIPGDGSKIKINGQRGTNPQYIFIDCNEQAVSNIRNICPDGVFQLGGIDYSWLLEPVLIPCTRCNRGSLCQLDGIEAICSGCHNSNATSPQSPSAEPAPTTTPAPTSVTAPAVALVQAATQRQRQRRTPVPAQNQTSAPDTRRRRNNGERQITSPPQPQAEPRHRRRQPQQHRRGPSPPQAKHQHRQQSNRGQPQRFIPPRLQQQERWPRSEPPSEWFHEREPAREFSPSYSGVLQRPPPPRDYDWPELPRSRYAAPQRRYRDYY